jgi:hypothetical protein
MRKKPKLCRKLYVGEVSLATLQALAPGENVRKKMEKRDLAV